VKILLAHPGASTSTSDIYDGLAPAFERAGHEVIEYRLDYRLNMAGTWLELARRKAQRNGKPLTVTTADILYFASNGIIERALRFEVDWVLVVSGMCLHPDMFILLRRAGIKTGIILTESPYDEVEESRILPHVDAAWTNERTCVERMRRLNPHVWYLPHAYDPARHYPGAGGDDVAMPSHDVVFVGTFFQERIDMLAGVNWDGIDLGLYGNVELMGSRSKLRRFVRGLSTTNVETAALYRRAKIGLNLYRVSRGFGRVVETVVDAESLNPRALELAATGCFTLSDARAEVGEVFGGAVPTFDTPQGLEFLIRSWLAMPDERAAVAARLPELVAGRTFDTSVRQIMMNITGVTVAAA
jgi:hypothetical protein